MVRVLKSKHLSKIKVVSSVTIYVVHFKINCLECSNLVVFCILICIVYCVMSIGVIDMCRYYNAVWLVVFILLL